MMRLALGYYLSGFQPFTARLGANCQTGLATLA
jgi:hypothetical protein